MLTIMLRLAFTSPTDRPMQNVNRWLGCLDRSENKEATCADNNPEVLCSAVADYLREHISTRPSTIVDVHKQKLGKYFLLVLLSVGCDDLLCIIVHTRK